MHIHPNSNLMLATLGVGREELYEVQARRAAEVRRKLSAASRAISEQEELSDSSSRVGRRSDEREPGSDDEDAFGRLFSAKA